MRNVLPTADWLPGRPCAAREQLAGCQRPLRREARESRSASRCSRVLEAASCCRDARCGRRDARWRSRRPKCKCKTAHFRALARSRSLRPLFSPTTSSPCTPSRPSPAIPSATRLALAAMPATRRSTRLLATPSGAPSPAGHQLLTPEQDADLAATSRPAAALPAPNRLAFKATRRPAAVNPKPSLPPTPKSPSSVLPFAPAPAADAAGPPSSAAAAATPASSTTIPPVLPFSFADARQHLISADPRFAALFAAHVVKPYEQPEPVDVWRCVQPVSLSRCAPARPGH